MNPLIAVPAIRIVGPQIKEVESPPQRYAPPGTPLRGTSSGATSTSSAESFISKKVQSVALRQSQPYVPRRTLPILLSSDSLELKPNINPDPKANKVILHCFRTENEAPLFTLGTRSAASVTRDTENVPFANILNYITPEELQRFENDQYGQEEEKERIRLLTMKPRGRPRKNPFAPADSTPKIGFQDKGKGSATTPKHGGYNAFRQLTEDGKPRRGRPVGWRKHAGTPTTTMPSFNGPQPTGRDSSPAEESDEDAETPMDIQRRTGVYSMVAASGLVPLERESSNSETSRSRYATPQEPLDEEIEALSLPEEPSPKRRKIHSSPSSSVASSSSDTDIKPEDLLEEFTVPQRSADRPSLPESASKKPSYSPPFENFDHRNNPDHHDPHHRPTPTKSSAELFERPSDQSHSVSSSEHKRALLVQQFMNAAMPKVPSQTTISETTQESSKSVVKTKRKPIPAIISISSASSSTSSSSSNNGMLVTPHKAPIKKSMTPLIPGSTGSRSSRLYGKPRLPDKYESKHQVPRQQSTSSRPRGRPPLALTSPTQKPASYPSTSTTSLTLDHSQKKDFNDITTYFVPMRKDHNTAPIRKEANAASNHSKTNAALIRRNAALLLRKANAAPTYSKINAARFRQTGILAPNDQRSLKPINKHDSDSDANSYRAQASNSPRGATMSASQDSEDESEEESDDESETSFMGVPAAPAIPPVPEEVRKRIDPQLMDAGPSNDSTDEEEDEDEVMEEASEDSLKRTPLVARKHW